jgi:hypothetical protein
MELKLFMTPAEELDLQILRQKVSKLYAAAFTQIEGIIYNAPETENPDFHPHFTVYDICQQTIKAAAVLAQQHLDKWEGK